MARKNGETSKEVTTQSENMHDLIPFGETPDYLEGQKESGLEALGRSDFKVPRIKLLQSNNPELVTYQGKAIPGEFWHSGANISLGSEFRFIPCIASKRVILFAPRNSDAEGILAMSRDAINWDMGANKRFEVKVKKIPNTLIWETGKNVRDSGLLEWGTFNREDEESGPAAQLSYEYLCFLPDHPTLSPVVMSTFRTAITNSKAFNTSLLMLRKPIQSVVTRCFAEQKADGDQAWFIPAFETKGWAPKELFEIASDIANKQKAYETEYTSEDATPASEVPY